MLSKQNVKFFILLTIISQPSVIRAGVKAVSSPWDYFYYSHRELDDGGQPCGGNWECGRGEICDLTCKCDPFHLRDLSGDCRPCPLEGQYCSKCCFGPTVECIDNQCVRCYYYGDSMQCVTKEEFYIITAAQITLIAAFAILIVVLCGILYHRCTKNSAQSRRRRAIRTGTLPSGRISVSSLQQGVLDRLRDAPPKYETRHNYTHHQKTTSTRVEEAEAGADDDQRGISQISGTVQAYGLAAPPPYDPADDRPLSLNPPSYTVATTPEETAKAELYQKLYGEEATTERSIRTDVNI